MALFDRSEMSRLRDAAFVREVLRAACEREGSQRAWAIKHGISPQFLSEVLNGRKEPSPAVLEPLGMRREVYYVAFYGPRKKRARADSSTQS